MKNKFFTLILSITTVLAFTACSDDDGPSQPIEIIIEGASVAPEVGGPNEPNQVYIDLSTNTATTAKRDSWDLGFYSGTDFRVVINGSIAMAAAQLSTSDIDAVSASDEEVLNLQPLVKTNTYTSESMPFVDAPNGDINNTAITEISDVNANNKVYIVNLGFETGTDTPTTGSIDINDDERGWKKIRVLRDGNDYVLQYADLNATTHEEITISKSNNFNFTFFSFNTYSEVSVEPETSNWDINFTVFTDETFIGQDSYGPYVYSDFVVNNIKSHVGIYMIDTEIDANLSYDTFTFANVVDANFIYNDQRVIGSSWRNSGGPGSLPSLKDNVFYIVNDTDGNLYKLKFLALTNEAGERGYPEFIYSLLK